MMTKEEVAQIITYCDENKIVCKQYVFRWILVQYSGAHPFTFSTNSEGLVLFSQYSTPISEKHFISLYEQGYLPCCKPLWTYLMKVFSLLSMGEIW